MASTKTDENEEEIARRLVAFLENSPESPKASLRKRDRGTYFRHIELVLIAQVGQPKVQGYTRNLSSGGVGLLTKRGFKVGERFATLLNFGAGLGKYVLCRVTFCRYVSECMYEVGAEFEATAPRLNNNHRIPEAWVTVARNRGTPAEAEAGSKSDK